MEQYGYPKLLFKEQVFMFFITVVSHISEKVSTYYLKRSFGLEFDLKSRDDDNRKVRFTYICRT